MDKDISFQATATINCNKWRTRRKFKLSSPVAERQDISSKMNGRKFAMTTLAAKQLSSSSVYLLLFALLGLNQLIKCQQPEEVSVGQPLNKWPSLPDLVSATSDEPIVAVVGQDAFISCVAKNLRNYTIIWRYSNEANAPAAEGVAPASDDVGVILTAGRQRVISDERFSVIQSHDTWLLKVTNVRQSDTGTYICQANSEPRVRALRILSVIKPTAAQGATDRPDHFEAIDYNFTDCCRADYVTPRCLHLCSFQQLASRYQSINFVHECFSTLPSVTRCMVAGRNVTDCCQRRHIPAKCNSMCGHHGDTSSMSIQDQTYCADYSAAIMSCVAEGINTLPGQPELVVVEAISSTQLKVSWSKVSDEKELSKIDGWIINLTKLSSFEDTISATSGQLSAATNKQASAQNKPATGTQTGAATSSFTSSTSSWPANGANPLASLTIVDVMNNSSLMAMTKLLATSSGTISLKLEKNLNEFSIDNLKPYTVYQIQMFAYNSRGRSQLTDPIRALTLAPEGETATVVADSSEAYVEPNLPDTRKCCLDRGVTLKRCLDTMCDPVEADKATIADLMICAPWSNVTFGCLSSRVDHSDCCKARGVSPFCLSMCSGEVKRVDYRHFRCLTYMATYTNCILESHNVLPSPPQNFTVGPITHTWAVLNWRAPKKHARSLQGYRIFWRRVEPANESGAGNNSLSTTSTPSPSSLLGDNSFNDEFFYSSAEAATNPYLLDALQAATVYETFVVAVNRFGQSESSARFIFQTLPDPEEVMKQQQRQRESQAADEVESRLPLHGNATPNVMQKSYNETTCCSNSGVRNSCLQLCDYDVKVTDAYNLVSSCDKQMPVIMRCLAGSRNSVPCCRNRGVNDQCLNVCAGLTEHSPLEIATRCASDFGRIIRCMDEGSKQIPSAPMDLHTADIKSDRVTIRWRPAPEDSLRTDVEYHIRYQQLQQSTSDSNGNNNNNDKDNMDDPSSLIAVVPLHPLEHNLILTTNQTEATIDKLKPNSRYSIYVTAENGYGISLPSLVLVAQTPDDQVDASKLDDYKRRATLGAPHSLEILRADTDSIILKWIAPLFINNDAQIRYRVFYKLLGTNGNSTSSTSTGNSEASGANQQQAISNWTVIETSDTTILLRNLKYSSQYAITVQAFSKKMLGHMSEILLASTDKPVPPTLNHPLVINNPVEGNNITIMCVALGQPTPQISMFINGLLVQKRTQPYVIYHLVNLVRGHLTITCFASNGHGKDYASVQSRTEVSVKFSPKATAKAREVGANPQATARLTCEINGNPQPSVVWLLSPKSSPNNRANTQASGLMDVVAPNERITTLLVSQFENPFTWSHTLTIRNVSESDLGTYECRARNALNQSSDSIRLVSVGTPLENTSGSADSSTSGDTASNTSDRLSYLKQVEGSSDLAECCRSQNVSAKCLPVCSADGLDVETAFKTPECQAHLDKLMYCAADGSDHRNCCRTRQVPSTCLRWCSGTKLNIPALCFLSSAIDINQCFQEGRALLPGSPRNVRARLASDSDLNEEDNVAKNEQSMGPMTSYLASSVFRSSSTNSADGSSQNQTPVINSVLNVDGNSIGEQNSSNTTDNNEQQVAEPIIVEWDPPIKNAQLVQYYRIFWRPFGSRELSRSLTNLTWIKLSDLKLNKQYELVVKAGNTHGSSVYSEPLKLVPAEVVAQSNSIGSSVGLIWFMPSAGGSSLFGRVLTSICFATLFMFCSLAFVMLLEKRGYLKRFASSKSNTSRISFANPAYLKDGDDANASNHIDVDPSLTFGHSLDILAPTAQPQQTSTPTSATAVNGTSN